MINFNYSFHQFIKILDLKNILYIPIFDLCEEKQ